MIALTLAALRMWLFGWERPASALPWWAGRIDARALRAADDARVRAGRAAARTEAVRVRDEIGETRQHLWLDCVMAGLRQPHGERTGLLAITGMAERYAYWRAPAIGRAPAPLRADISLGTALLLQSWNRWPTRVVAA